MVLKTVVIYQPQGVAIFEVGKRIIEKGEETDIVVMKVQLNLFNTVKVSLSNGKAYVYSGFPVSFEK